ncbi:MAG: alpha-glycosidase, partial [Chloroflexi bacterium]|nr:alpha-glycosidase [Chloroflexota bacterium]
NHAHRPVQEYILRVARFWLEEAGIDGWRLDVPFKIPFDFWREFRQVVKAVSPEAYLVGEVWREAAPWVQGDVFDGVTNYRLRDLVLDYVQTEVLDGEDFGFELHSLLQAHGPAAGAMLNLLGSHDTARILTLLKGDLERLRIALTLQMTLPGAPMIYYGDEVGLTGETDPGCRGCMPWDRAQWNLPLRQTVRRLAALRRAHPALRYGRPEKLAAFNGVYAYRMAAGEDEVLVVLNPREGVGDFDLPLRSARRAWQDAESGRRVQGQEGVLRLDTVPPRSAQVLVPAQDQP